MITKKIAFDLEQELIEQQMYLSSKVHKYNRNSLPAAELEKGFLGISMEINSITIKRNFLKLNAITCD